MSHSPALPFLIEPIAEQGGAASAEQSKPRQHPGRISVLDRAGLERRTCECYAVVKREYARLLPDGVAT
jgi:hypothetical protein